VRVRAAARWTWVDLRLAPAALSVWAGCLAAPYLSPAALACCAAGAVVVAVAVAATTRRRSSTAATVALGVLAALAVTATTASLRGAAREASPLRPFAESGRTLTAVLHLDGDPHRLAGAGEVRLVADATVTGLTDGRRNHRMDGAVLLFASGEDWLDLLPGQDVRVRLGVSLPRPGDDVVAVVSARLPPTPLGAPSLAQRAAGSLRDGLASSAARMLDPGSAGLLPGLVVGDTRAMDPVLEEDFRRAGLTHLTAVSGANVG
jgi:competence protein ComEC